MNHLLALIAVSKSIGILAIVVQPSPYRWLLWLPIAMINGYYYFNSSSSDSMRLEVLLDVLIASDYILLTDVQREFRLVGQREPISNSGTWTRFRWAIQLLFSPRGVGWTHEPKSIIPPHPNLTRLQFLRSRVVALIVALIRNDIVSILTSIDPGFSRIARPFDEQPLAWRLWATALFFFRLKSFMNLCHLMIALVLVGTGTSEPGSWPNLFGNWTDAYTVRRWWGRVWHQQLRRIFSSHGKFLAHRVLGLSPGGHASSYTQLYLGFFLSGLIHAMPFDPRPIRFFMSQAVVITIEDVVIALMKRAGLRSSGASRLLGYVWVYSSLVFTFGPWIDSMNTIGIGEYDGALFLSRYCDKLFLKKLLFG